MATDRSPALRAKSGEFPADYPARGNWRASEPWVALLSDRPGVGRRGYIWRSRPGHSQTATLWSLTTTNRPDRRDPRALRVPDLMRSRSGPTHGKPVEDLCRRASAPMSGGAQVPLPDIRLGDAVRNERTPFTQPCGSSRIGLRTRDQTFDRT